MFIIIDFGFAYIPKKLKIDWMYSQDFKYLTKNGHELYDIVSLVKSIRKYHEV
jgi:hypothetical protein